MSTQTNNQASTGIDLANRMKAVSQKALTENGSRRGKRLDFDSWAAIVAVTCASAVALKLHPFSVDGPALGLRTLTAIRDISALTTLTGSAAMLAQGLRKRMARLNLLAAAEQDGEAVLSRLENHRRWESEQDDRNQFRNILGELDEEGHAAFQQDMVSRIAADLDRVPRRLQAEVREAIKAAPDVHYWLNAKGIPLPGEKHLSDVDWPTSMPDEAVDARVLSHEPGH